MEGAVRRGECLGRRKAIRGCGRFWLVEDLLGVTDFQELAGTHDGDARGDLRHHRQAVRDENVSEREFALEFLKQKKNLRADGDIEGGDGFVGDNELWLENQRARNEIGKVKLEIPGIVEERRINVELSSLG